MGSILPKYCPITGERATYSHPIHQIWQPRWVYSLLYFFVIPYALVSPFVHRRIELIVPFGSTLYAKHRRKVNFGLAIIVVSSLLAILTIILASYGLYPLSRFPRSDRLSLLCWLFGGSSDHQQLAATPGYPESRRQSRLRAKRTSRLSCPGSRSHCKLTVLDTRLADLAGLNDIRKHNRLSAITISPCRTALRRC